MAYYNLAERMPGKVVLYLNPDSALHPPVPFELQTFILPEEWDGRMRVIMKTAKQYSKPWLERAWVATALFTTFILPWAIYNLVYNKLKKNIESDKRLVEFQVKLIMFAIFLGVWLLFWIPIFVWKLLGRNKMQKIMKQWAEADVLARGTGAFVPMWWVRTPGIFDSRAILTVSTPSTALPTLFHPNAYLPTYVQPPQEYSQSYVPDQKLMA